MLTLIKQYQSYNFYGNSNEYDFEPYKNSLD